MSKKLPKGCPDFQQGPAFRVCKNCGRSRSAHSAEAKMPKAPTHPLRFDTVCGEMSDPMSWILDSKGRYLMESVSEDDEGLFIKDATERNKAISRIVKAANAHDKNVAALRRAHEYFYNLTAQDNEQLGILNEISAALLASEGRK